ncbi:hypothetical protein AVEN_74663-1, partial [Araneus ventricosus]
IWVEFVVVRSLLCPSCPSYSFPNGPSCPNFSNDFFTLSQRMRPLVVHFPVIMLSNTAATWCSSEEYALPGGKSNSRCLTHGHLKLLDRFS